jgi:hypothetical protein
MYEFALWQARKKALPRAIVSLNFHVMSVEFQILGSSSGGNCALLQTGQTKVLVDVGFSAKRIGCLLESVGESLDAIDAVFLTHEHNDHAQGIRGLAKRADLPVFANHDTADAVQAKATKPVNWKVFQTGTEFTFRDLKVRSFALPHDAYDPVGFTFKWGEEGDLFTPPRSLAWVTDLGLRAGARQRAHPRRPDTCNRSKLRRRTARARRAAALVNKTADSWPTRTSFQ